MYSEEYKGPRIEVTILKTGAKHKTTQSYLRRLSDASSKVTLSTERRSSLVCFMLSYFSVIQASGFQVLNREFSTMGSGFVKYIPFIPITDTGEKLWEFTFIFAVTNNSLELPDELCCLSDEEKDAIYKTIAVGSEECLLPIQVMNLLSVACHKLKEL